GAREAHQQGDQSAERLGRGRHRSRVGFSERRMKTMFSLNGKVAIVTGGSRGIGRVTSEVLAAQGAHVVLTYVKGEEEAKKVAAGIVERGGKAEIAGFDAGNMEACDKAVAEIAKRLGRLDIMVCNAGIAIDGLLLRVKEEDLDRIFAVNVKGAL